MDISIVIITRNEEKRIASCLQSLCEQYSDGLFEILVVDGDSTDGTVEIVQKFQARYRYISLIRCKQYGYGYQRNIGVLNAKGRYVLFLSGDVVVSKKLISKYSKHLDAYDIIQGSVINVIDKIPFSQHIMEACYIIYHDYLCTMSENFSTVNVCVKKDLLLSRVFDEKLIALEDKEWALNFEGAVEYYRLKSGCVYHLIHDGFFQYGKKIYKEARTVGGIVGKKASRGLKGNANFFEWYSYTKHFLLVLAMAIAVFVYAIVFKKLWLSFFLLVMPILYKCVYIAYICRKEKIRLNMCSFWVTYYYYDCVFGGIFGGLLA
ncbi:MAG: glycosyltransferase [Lachnospiraceae bacterium]|nr:glycosyltransferase [Lachnospiraceae bacterium]